MPESVADAREGIPAACLGELLIDMVPDPVGVPLAEVAAFRPATGGAPANVAAGLARLGDRCRFIGKVGDDAFGRKAVQVLAAAGVQVDQVRFTAEARTTLAFVALQADGERDFLFYREPGADTLLRPEDLEPSTLAAAPIFHHGSISLIAEPARSATLTALGWAHEGGALVSYDPNLREPLWPGPSEAHRGIRSALPWTHILKVSASELAFLVGEGARFEPPDREPEPAACEAGAAELLEALPGLVAVVVTFGRKGAAVQTRAGWSFVGPFRVEARDATGAGDGFVAGLLHWIWRAARKERVTPLARARTLDRDGWAGATRFAQAVGALTTTRYGAIPALPTLREVAALLADEGEMELL
ncbi:PfkB family carbohydrate kinase [Limnochorda pilosa]|uniref:Fructokinase-like n=1 Tax=Limnochorda pilosa TaxID=1555112 RepID=A0A0K2SP99_LIMPI|nr:PfkB family carbohydrate kinase [Limnochorda pilosa]BAS28822.1 fructokinase-like [Limnochorda pilosa]